VIDKAIFIANSGRKGPVWIDIPLNVQGAMIDETKLMDYNSGEDAIVTNPDILNQKVKEVVQLILKSKRPVVIAGHGIRLSDGLEAFRKLIKVFPIPVVTTFNGFDLISSDHPNYAGRIGIHGTRSGNFTLQNADLILCLGTRNIVRQVSYNWQNFGQKAIKIVVDIDPAELAKPTVKPDIPILADVNSFCACLTDHLLSVVIPDFPEWMKWVKERLIKYPVVLPEYINSRQIHPYYFIQRLTEIMNHDAVLVAGNGTACVGAFQAGKVKEGQRMFWNSGCASMGYDLPASIGACIGKGEKEVICLAGDGSIQMNIQELQTIKHYNLPIKIFYLNNAGYSSIRQMQDNFFEGRRVASNVTSGVSFPDIVKLAGAYEIPSATLSVTSDIDDKLREIFNQTGPVLCEVVLNPNYFFSPKVSSEKLPDGRMISKPLEDMFPFLERDDYNSNII
jgi:acetolactate synthase-1/2/3 large subunit